MNDELIERLEQQIGSAHASDAPKELRAKVLADVARELRASRWDRWLARGAAAALVIGVALNAAAILPGRQSSAPTVAAAPRQDALVQVATTVAEATNFEMGRRVARRIAAMAGRPLSIDDAAALDAAIERHRSRNGSIRKAG